MVYIDTIGTYLMIGICWALWLEFFTTRNLSPPYNKPWVNKERMFHTTLWPFTLIVFLYNFLRDIFK
jgi:hypothetical protein